MQDITFSEEQQLALLGHAILTPRVLETMIAIGIPKTLFSKATPQKVYGALENFFNTYHRAPTVEELKNGELHRDEPKIVESTMSTIEGCMSKKTLISLPSIYGDVIRWKLGGVVISSLTDMANLWNKKDQDAVIDKIHTLSNQLNHITRNGLSATVQQSDKWLDVSIQRQNEIGPKLIETGVSYIDDALVGLRPDALLVVASRTGIGKTELLSRIALNVAKQNKKPAYFALEAGQAEIESRMRFPIVLRNYNADKTVQHKQIDYVAWYNNKYPDLIKYEPSKEQLSDAIKNIWMLYKKTSHYGIKQLEKDIMSIVNDVDIIIIDHLHYIDREGKDENSALQDIISRIRDINLAIDKPVILASHVRKNQEKRKDRALIPELDDIHGSSDISKVSTAVLTLAQMAEIEEDKAPVTQLLSGGYGKPTLFKFLKHREGGASRTAYTGVGFYDRGVYRKEYVVGKLSSYDQKWDPIPFENRPGWATSAIEMPKLRP
jgi:replicative DNA helicase